MLRDRERESIKVGCAMNIYRRILAAIIIAVVPCGDLVVTLQAATPAAQSSYRASGSPNPNQVRRVVMNLGVGGYVEVSVNSGKTVHGHILEIFADHFVLLLDRPAAPVDIAYGDVLQLGRIGILRLQWWRSAERIIGTAALIFFFVVARMTS